MLMFHSYQALTQLLVTAGEVRGRKKLQKMVYIAQSLGYGYAEPFQMHVWGPYSEVLAVKVKEMVDWGFAQEAVLPGPANNQHYVYTPGPNAARVAGAEDPALTALVADLNGRDATFLEGVATALFLRGQGKDDQAILAALPRLKPDKFADAGRVAAVIDYADGLERYRI